MRKIVPIVLFLVLTQEIFSAQVNVSVTIKERVQKEIPPSNHSKIEMSTGTEKEIILEIPAQAFISTVSITVERRTDFPAPDPLKQANLKGTGLGVEIILSEKLNQNFLQPQKSIRLTFKYTNDEIGNMKKENLTLARYNQGEWILLPSEVYPDKNKIVAEITHLSLFQIVERVPAKTVDDIFVYPNPGYLNKKQKLTFTRLPANAKITIYTISGEKVFETIDEDGISYTWSPENLAGGIYIYIIKDTISGKKKTGKLAIIK